jgi:hypothetical protein
MRACITATLVPCDPWWVARILMNTVTLVGHVARAPTVRGVAAHPLVPFPLAVRELNREGIPLPLAPRARIRTVKYGR